MAPSTHTPDQIAAEYQSKVYRVERLDVKATSTGSGVLLANDSRRGLIATSRRAIALGLDLKKGMTVEVKNATQLQAKTATVAAIHKNLDLALLVIDTENAVPDAVSVARQDRLRDGEAAVAMGYPLGLQLNTTPGIISNHRGDDGLVWTNCPMSPGNSGGPLFLQRRGLLAGLNSESAAKGQSMNGAVPAEQIIVSLQEGHIDNWVWNSELRDDVLRLVARVRLEN